jgi:5-methylthioadenosine/S-adenosylhomocysteine deaminase
MSYLLKGGQLITNNPQRDVIKADLLIQDNKIQKLAENIPASSDVETIDVSNQLVIPGFVQAHTHLCQALFRGYADDLSLLEWLEEKIWPMEHAHDTDSIAASADLGLLEMQLAGTTSIFDMGTVRNMHSILERVEKSGMRYWGGKCFMDLKESSGPLYEDKDTSLSETRDLIKNWHHKTNRIHYTICPRFAVSCTEEMLTESFALAQEFGLKYHIHASENKDEVAMIKERTGKLNVEYLDSIGTLGKDTVIIHGVHLEESELARMIETDTHLVHCPTANLKLASGFAPIHKYRQAGLVVGIGADGAPCNNTMDPFYEMRLAALIQKPLFGPEALPAQQAFEMATIEGAKVLGKENEIGSLEEGKLADIATIDLTHPSVATVENPYSALVYSCSSRDVTNVFIDGERVVANGQHQNLDHELTVAHCHEQLGLLLKRV